MVVDPIDEPESVTVIPSIPVTPLGNVTLPAIPAAGIAVKSAPEAFETRLLKSLFPGEYSLPGVVGVTV